MKVAFCTLGCKVNYYESKAISEILEKENCTVVPFEKGADVYIINTCAVTAEAERKCAQMVRRAVSFGAKKVIVTGCSAQLHHEKYEKIEGVTYVCGNRKKLDAALASLKDDLPSPDYSLEGAQYENMSITSSERTRAYVKIEDGCDAKCAYCIIRTARGHIRSRLIKDALEEVKTLAENGYKEIVFTGIEISGFGKDTGEKLSDMIKEASLVDGIERIRLSSVDPSFLRKDFIDEVSKIKKFTHYFHLSLQSGCDKTLANMRRRYTSSMILEYTDYIREKMPDAEFAADVIVGFPGETDEDFRETAEFIKKIALQHFHIFTYSKRPGTEASVMPCQVEPEIKREREKTLSAIRSSLGMSVRSKYIGRTVSVLFETSENGVSKGHTDNFIEVEVKTNESLHSQFKNVLIEGVTETGAYGSIVE